MNSNETTFYRKMHKSVFKMDSYQEVVKASLGQAMVYVLILGLFVGSLSMIRPTMFIFNGLEDFETSFVERFPEFEISDGKLHLDGNESFVFREQNIAFILDPNADDVTVMDDYNNAFLFDQSKIHYKMLDLKGTLGSYNENELINKEILVKEMPQLKLGAVIAFLIGTIMMTINKYFYVLFISVIGLLVCRMGRYKRSFHEVIKISAYVITLPSLMDLLLGVLGFNVNSFGILMMPIVFIYFSAVFRRLHIANEME